MSIQKVEMTIEQKENGQYVEQVAYPYVEYEHVTMENGMDIMSMIRDDVSTPLVTHNTTSWKVGQGDSDVSETIVDSSVASMTIKGQTYQNILPNPSLRNSMTNGKTMQKLNEGYDSVNTVDGVCKSAILSGNTLVNLIHSKNVINNSKKYVILNNLSENKKYIAIFPYITNAKYAVYNMTMNTFIINYTTSNKLIFTSPSSAYEVRLYVAFDDATMELPSNALDIVCIEYQEGMENWDIPYFEGMQSVKMPVLKTTGKNLFDGKIEKSSIDVTTGSITPNVSSSWSATNYINVKNINSLYFQTSQLSNMNIVYMCFDENKNFIGYKGFYNSLTGIITPLNNTHYIRLRLPSDIDVSTTQIEQGTQPTSYEPYKTNILSTSKDVVLRGIGDVRDTLDCLTGEVTKRIGEIVLDGSENWVNSDNSLTNTHRFSIALPDFKSSGLLFNDGGFKNITSGTSSDDTKNIQISGTSLYLRIDRSVADDVFALKDYLSKNNLTVYGELTENSIKTVDLSILDQDNQPIKQLNSFANGYIQVSSQGLIPSVDYEVPTSNSYYLDLAKPSTQYTMKNMIGTFTLDGTQYNASANGTFTSPSTLSNRLMITSVAQSQPMLLEGDMTSEELPYVDGIKSAFEDESKIEVLSTGKNLFDGAFEKGIIKVNGNLGHSTTAIRTVNYISVKPNTSYHINLVNLESFESLKAVYVHEYDKNYKVLREMQVDNRGVYTSQSETRFIKINTHNNNNLPVDSKMIVCENSTNEQQYEPYKSNITKIPLLSPLRSLPNGVRDEVILDRENNKAKIIQRVGEDLTQLATPIVTEVNLEGYPYVYKDGRISLNTEIAPVTEVTYSINQAHQIESSNEDILRHQKEINYLYELIAQYVQVQYEAELIDIAL